MNDFDVPGHLRRCLARAADHAGEGARTFTQLFPDAAHAEAVAAQERLSKGASLGPLDGMIVSVKDLFDVGGSVTTAGSLLLRSEPPAERDARAVALARQAGAILIGKTGMTEFAYSGVGLNPHYGTPLNPHGREVGRVPGGSSSGAAVSVADGAADLALATDTGGSVRIPAALCGLVGWKPTASRISRAGVVPLSPSLDAVGVIARSLDVCIAADAALADRAFGRAVPSRAAAPRLGVLSGFVQLELDTEVAAAFGEALGRLHDAGIELVDIEMPEIDRLATGGVGAQIVAHEAFAYHCERLASQGDMYDPRVRRRIEGGAAVSAEQYRSALAARRRAADVAAQALDGLDGWLMPTVPMVAPPLSACDSDDEFFRINGLLLRNTAIVNLIDGCAVTLPCPRPRASLPVGISLAGPAGWDANVLARARLVERALWSSEAREANFAVSSPCGAAPAGLTITGGASIGRAIEARSLPH